MGSGRSLVRACACEVRERQDNVEFESRLHMIFTCDRYEPITVDVDRPKSIRNSFDNTQ